MFFVSVHMKTVSEHGFQFLKKRKIQTNNNLVLAQSL